LGKGELIWKQACPTWASANSFTGKLAQAGQGRICFTSQLPKLGKNGRDKKRLNLWEEVQPGE